MSSPTRFPPSHAAGSDQVTVPSRKDRVLGSNAVALGVILGATCQKGEVQEEVVLRGGVDAHHRKQYQHVVAAVRVHRVPSGHLMALSAERAVPSNRIWLVYLEVADMMLRIL